MQKATVTYVAPPGDNKVVEMGGVTFFDGIPVDLNSRDHTHLVNKLPGNQHFDVELGEDVQDEPRKRPGRPSNADKAAAEAKLKGISPEQQQASQLSQNYQGAGQQANNALNVT